MGREYASSNKERNQSMKQRAEANGSLTKALWGYASNTYSGGTFSILWKELTAVYGKAPNQLKSVEEFWNPDLKKAVAQLAGDAFVQDMEAMTRMRMEGQFSSSMWRRSYRSNDFGYHAVWAISELCNCIFLSTFTQDIETLLAYQHDWLKGFDVSLALEIRKGNPSVISKLEDAMLGENQNMLLTSAMVRAMIISGDERLIDILLKLLVAARLQEGLRQQILENADRGSVETLTKILKVCLDEDLFRYSSVIRAFDTWTGLGYGDAKPNIVKQYAQLAWECLTDEKVRRQKLDSENNLEAYLAMWSVGCYEVAETDDLAEKLLNDDRKYRRCLGWFFVSHIENETYRMNRAKEHLEERDEELLAWIFANLAVTRKLLNSSSYGRTEWKCEPEKNEVFPENDKARRELFFKLKEAALYVGNKKHTYTGNPFTFSSIELNSGRAIDCMMGVAGYDMDPELIDELMQLLPYMEVSQRRAFYSNFVNIEKYETHREYLRKALDDRSVHIKELVVQRFSCSTLTDADVEAMADSLRSKSSSLRKAVMSIFLKQKPENMTQAIHRLLRSKEEYQIQAGIELLLQFRETEPDFAEAYRETLTALEQAGLSTQTVILLDQMKKAESTQDADWTEENGYGLYDPEKAAAEAKIQEAFAEISDGSKEKTPDAFFSEEEYKRILPTAQEIAGLWESMNAVFDRHANEEIEIELYDGSRKKVLFGDVNWYSIPISVKKASYAEIRQNGKRLDMIPFYEEFIEAAKDFLADPVKYAGLYYTCVQYRQAGYSDYANRPWYAELVQKEYCVTYHGDGYKRYQRRYWHMMEIIGLFAELLDAHALFLTAFRCYRSIVKLVGEERLTENCIEQKKDSRIRYATEPVRYLVNDRIVGCWRLLLKKTAKSKEDFQDWFLYEHRLERRVKVGVIDGLVIEDYFRAADEGLVPKDAVYEQLLLGSNAQSSIQLLTNPVKLPRGKKILDAYDWAPGLVKRTVLRIVDVEALRGELPTPLTGVARSIKRFEGAAYFCKLLAALGKENFFRGYEYSSDTTKRAVLSRLLKRCYPAKEDTPQTLKALLKQTDIKDKRLAEAVMYAPQWAGFAEEILEWPGLRSAVWFFHAHINETFSAEKETEVAMYSPITPQQFNDGAFDKDWFFEAYEQLGEKKFQILYKSAKYITSGSNQHRRSQLYADAVLGRLDAEELKAEIIEKRNQEKLRCYPLIPIREDQPDEALRRYEFIQKFLKESKQFGSQRKESEKKACATAMENLAITTGFFDVNRMTWYLESEKLEEIRPLMEPKELEGVTVCLEITEDGTPELKVEKNGKRLKALPKTLTKDAYILSLKESIKELKEQKRRAKESLEKAMVDSTEFTMEELSKISTNPVLYPMLSALVWTNGEKSGFMAGAGDGLYFYDWKGAESGLPADSRLRVAHPYDLYQEGSWTEYMHYVYEKKLVQPFKQIFREYYVLTEDEKQEKNISRRYAGHQVQPKQTVALLKGRGWTVDYEEGLQKVYYKEDLIVRMYALADWFSPADIEAPTLETIRFFDRKTGEIIDLERIPPILFSEAMRDMDLVVSVAHVGGVDPEASHSTVEMRTAIAKELVKLLKLTNVEFIGSHAKIYGSLANYSVHMGSGVVHAEAIGMLAILPVHSQARGRIFLPFADEDPKTAEIMSKIILLSEDKKIKDPSILNQIG